MRPMFHHAFTVSDLAATRRFYTEVLGCVEGRKKGSDKAADFDFFGHHVVAHLVEGPAAELQRRAAQGANVAIRHFGVILPWPEWCELADTLRAHDVSFVVEPRVLYPDKPHEEALMMLVDPSGNGIEFKTFRNREFLPTSSADGSADNSADNSADSAALGPTQAGDDAS